MAPAKGQPESPEESSPKVGSPADPGSPTTPRRQDKGVEDGRKPDRRGSLHKGVEKGDRKGSLGSKSFADTLASRQGQTLHDFYRIEPEIPEHVINWSLNCFGYFDTSTNSLSKTIVRDPHVGEMDMWEIREALFMFHKDLRHGITDELVVEMIRSVGKVEHSTVTINFREFVSMCWKWFFAEPKEEKQDRDVQEAFELLGGGPGTEGQVSVEKMKLFASGAQLTIDVDKFVGEVDEDGSGLVDYDEFCKLFADSKIDTNLHDSGAMWLRNYKDDVLAADRLRIVSPGSLFISTDEKDLTPGPNASSSPPPENRGLEDTMRTHGSPLKQHGEKRQGFFREDSPAALQAPRMKKALQHSLPKFVPKAFHNSVDTKCRHGWRVSQPHRNNPRLEGYNFYHVKSEQFDILSGGPATVKMRKRGAEYSVKEHSSNHMNIRLSTEMRCLRQTKILMSRPQSRASTAMSGSLYDVDSNMSMRMSLSAAASHTSAANIQPHRSVSRNNSRPQTSAIWAVDGSVKMDAWTMERRRNLPPLNMAVSTTQTLKLDPDEGSRPPTSWGNSTFDMTARRYSYKDPTRPKDWQTNMKIKDTSLDTTEILKLAASAGLYDGKGYCKEVGPGISFFDNSPTSPLSNF